MYLGGRQRQKGRLLPSSHIATVGVRGWSSLVARRAHNPKVAGSNPAPATTKALVTALSRPGPRRPQAILLTDLLTDDPARGDIFELSGPRYRLSL